MSDAQSQNSSLSVLQTLLNPALAISITLILLLFVSIVPLACADIWWEAIVFVIIFIVCGVQIFQPKYGEIEIENRSLLVPLSLLAVYSFVQGLTTILGQTYVFLRNPFFPESFDSTASIWNAFKILAIVLFLRLLLQSFQRRVEFLSWSLIFIGNFFAVFGIARFLFQESLPGIFERFISPQLTPGVGFGTYFNQNHFAYLMLMVFGLNIGLFRYGDLSKLTRFFLLIAGVITWTALVLTASRGGIISSFVEIAVLLFLPAALAIKEKGSNRSETFRSKIFLVGRRVAVLAVVFGLLITGIVLIGQDRVIGRFEEIPNQIEGITNAATFRRIDVWEATLRIIRDYPIFGIGFGGFRVAVSQYIDISGRLVPKQAHNDYLEFVASGGAAAVALAVWFLFSLFSLVRKRFAEPSDSFSRSARVGALCGVAGIALHSFFDFGLQLTANLLFLSALMAIAVHKSWNQKDESKTPSLLPLNIPQPFGLFELIFCLTAACLAAYFGFAHYQYELAKIAPSTNLIKNEFYRIPFDAGYYETKAVVYDNSGDYVAATSELKKAIERRPKDYNLWLGLGRLEQSQNHHEEAENAYRSAIELAPLYGEPHLNYGNFLVVTNRKNEGFSELRIASRRNPQYFDELFGLIWSETGGNMQQIRAILMPFETSEKDKIIAFLFDKNDFAPLVRFVCREEDLTPPHRDLLVKKLLEKNLFYFADQINKRNCDASGGEIGVIEDGSFETGELKKGAGFGWRINASLEKMNVALDGENPQGKGRSLRLDFDGQDDSAPLLSQIVTVEKNRKFKLGFSYKTTDLVTGGVPVLQIILKHSDSENLIKEIQISLKDTGWVRSSIEFQTDDRTEAIEIRLARQSCTQSQCPIFGHLWLSDFRLQKKP